MNTSIPLIHGPENYSTEPGLACDWIASDSLSGIYETVVTINEVLLPGDDLVYTFAEKGTYLIDYYSTDNVGNSEDVNHIYSTILSLSFPVIT